MFLGSEDLGFGRCSKALKTQSKFHFHPAPAPPITTTTLLPMNFVWFTLLIESGLNGRLFFTIFFHG